MEQHSQKQKNKITDCRATKNNSQMAKRMETVF